MKKFYTVMALAVLGIGMAVAAENASAEATTGKTPEVARRCKSGACKKVAAGHHCKGEACKNAEACGEKCNGGECKKAEAGCKEGKSGSCKKTEAQQK